MHGVVDVSWGNEVNGTLVATMDCTEQEIQIDQFPSPTHACLVEVMPRRPMRLHVNKGVAPSKDFNSLSFVDLCCAWLGGKFRLQFSPHVSRVSRIMFR